MSELEMNGSDGAGSRGLMGLVLCLICILVRGQGLMALPLFSDEAIYLRWGQLVRGGHWWVSLADPKPPLHFWLLAGVMGWSRDPLLAARSVSVAAGVLSIPALLWVCDEIGFLVRVRNGGGVAPSGRILGILAAVLMIFCPFLAFYQRLATADALFVLEMLLAVWLGLRWGRRAVTGSRAWLSAIALGVVLGAAMMTRQGLSYTLWGIPAAGVALSLRGRLSMKRWGAIVGQGACAVVIALVLWTPFLTADLGRFTADARAEAAASASPGEHVNAWTVIAHRILYQQQFTQGSASRLDIAGRNAAMAFLPPRSHSGVRPATPDGGWFFVYLTWPMYLAGVLGLGWLGFRGQWRVLVLLVVWMALMLGPVIVLGNVVYSRYVLAGVMPLLIAGGYFLAELLSLALSVRLSPWITWTVAGAFFVGLLILPLRDIGRQATTWWTQPLTTADRAQYITGWTNGLATRKALAFLKGYAPGGPVVVITDSGWGLPADAAWVYLAGIPNMEVYYSSSAGEGPLLRPDPSGKANRFMLRKDKWLYTPAEPVTIPADASVLYLIGEPSGEEFAIPAAVRQFNANLKPVWSFYGIDHGPAHVALFEVK